jgi:hypothetical protein
MRKTLLCGGVALFAAAAAPCFAQDAVSTAGAEIGKAANQAARQAADHAAASVGMSSKSTDKKSLSSQQAKNSGGKPVYSGVAAEDGAAAPDQPANAQPNKDPSDGKAP